MKLFRQYVSSAVDCNRIKNSAWKRCIMEAEFEWELKNEERDVLYEKNPIQVLRREMHFAEIHDDGFFRQRCSQGVDGAVHHLMECKPFFLNTIKQRER